MRNKQKLGQPLAHAWEGAVTPLPGAPMGTSLSRPTSPNLVREAFQHQSASSACPKYSVSFLSLPLNIYFPVFCKRLGK